MPTISISPKVRFVLYLIGLIGAVVVQYAIDKAWFGEAEFRLWSGVAAVLFMLAAAKTDLGEKESAERIGAEVADQINRGAQLGTAKGAAARETYDGIVRRQQERGQSGEAGMRYLAALALIALVVLLLATAGVFS